MTCLPLGYKSEPQCAKNTITTCGKRHVPHASCHPQIGCFALHRSPRGWHARIGPPWCISAFRLCEHEFLNAIYTKQILEFQLQQARCDENVHVICLNWMSRKGTYVDIRSLIAIHIDLGVVDKIRCAISNGHVSLWPLPFDPHLTVTPTRDRCSNKKSIWMTSTYCLYHF